MAEVKYIEEIANGIENLKKSLGKDVVEMCTLLKTVVEAIRERSGLPKELTDTITKHIQDIYQCLKLHLVFHGVEHETADLECNTSSKPRKPAKSDIPRLDPYKELEKLGPILHLKDEDLKNEILPDPTSVLDYCVDPWSTLIEIVSMSFLMF